MSTRAILFLTAFCLAAPLLLLHSRKGVGLAYAKAPSADSESAVLVGAGDIADCTDLSGAEATANCSKKSRAPSWLSATSPIPTAHKRTSIATTGLGAA